MKTGDRYVVNDYDGTKKTYEVIEVLENGCYIAKAV